MTAKDRPHHHRPHGRRVAVATTAILTLGLAACGNDTTGGATASPTTTTTTAVRRPSVTLDGSVRIDHGRMRIRCVGEGATTVLLIAGWGDAGDGWGAIEPAIAERARVCSYARFGLGTSDPPPATQTFATQAADLRALLDQAGEPGPYVVLGHSFGGAEAVTFASENAADVTGLLLLDASPVTWPSAVCAVPDDGTEAAATFRANCAAMKDPTQNPERLDVFAAFDAAATITSLGDLPMTVMTGTQRSAPGLADAELARLNRVWNDGARRWAALSTASNVVPVEGTSHYIQIDKPELVVDQLLALLPNS